MVKPRSGTSTSCAPCESAFRELPLAAYNVSGSTRWSRLRRRTVARRERGRSRADDRHPECGRGSRRQYHETGAAGVAAEPAVKARSTTGPRRTRSKASTVPSTGFRRRRDDVARQAPLHAAPRIRPARTTPPLDVCAGRGSARAVLYEDVTIRPDVALLTLSEAPEAFVSDSRSFLQSSRSPRSSRSPSSPWLGQPTLGYEQDLERRSSSGRADESSTPRRFRGRWYPLPPRRLVRAAVAPVAGHDPDGDGGGRHGLRARRSRLRHPLAARPRPRDNDFVVGLLGRTCTRSRSSSSAMRKTSRRRSISSGSGRSSSGGWRGRAALPEDLPAESRFEARPSAPRHAGRYQPAYRAIRERTRCRGDPHPELAAQVTLLPIDRSTSMRNRLFGHPSPLVGMGLELDFVKGDGRASATRSRRRATSITRHASRGGDDGGDARGHSIVRRELDPRGVPVIAFAGAHVHARELRDRGRLVEGLREDEGVHALRAGCVEAAPREARHGAGRLPARAGRGGRSGAAGLRLVGRPGARARGLPPLRRAAQPRAVRQGERRRSAGDQLRSRRKPLSR